MKKPTKKKSCENCGGKFVGCLERVKCDNWKPKPEATGFEVKIFRYFDMENGYAITWGTEEQNDNFKSGETKRFKLVPIEGE